MYQPIACFFMSAKQKQTVSLASFSDAFFKKNHLAKNATLSTQRIWSLEFPFGICLIPWNVYSFTSKLA